MTPSVTNPLVNGGRLVIDHEAMPLEIVPPSDKETGVVPDGIGAEITADVASDGPLFVHRSVYVNDSPASTDTGAVVDSASDAAGAVTCVCTMPLEAAARPVAVATLP